MSPVWVRPIRPEDEPLLREWLEGQRATTAFDPALAKDASILVAYDDTGPLGFFPAWLGLIAGCPLERDALSELRRAEMAVAVVQQLAFSAPQHGAREIATATSDEGTERVLKRCGFRRAGIFMRRRNG